MVVGHELVSVEGGDTSDRLFGLAFDIGTTTVVGMLIDLNSGAPVAVRSALNGQAVQGADVISRISYTMLHEDGLSELNGVILRTLNGLIAQLLHEGEVAPHEVYEVVTAGNATMQHLFLGVDPEPIGLEPFIPAVEDMVQASAQEVGLAILPQAQVHCLPYLGAYVGADLVAGPVGNRLGAE